MQLATDGRLRISNKGAAVPPEELVRLRQRYVRSKTMASGSGIGLAIVEAIVEGSGLQLTLRSPASAQNDGFEAEINVVII